MSRTLSQVAQAAINAEETGEVFLLLLEFDEASLSEPIRVVWNNVNVTSRGNVYAAMEFSAELPGETEGASQSVRITLDNVDRQIVQAVRNAVGRPAVTMEIVLASDPDTVEAGPFNFELESVEYNALTVSGELIFDDVSNLRCPQHTATPYLYPDAF